MSEGVVIEVGTQVIQTFEVSSSSVVSDEESNKFDSIVKEDVSVYSTDILNTISGLLYSHRKILKLYFLNYSATCKARTISFLIHPEINFHHSERNDLRINSVCDLHVRSYARMYVIQHKSLIVRRSKF